MGKMLQEFRAFALRGNVLDLAVAVILGIAFGTVVASLTNDVLMQIVAAIFGQPDFSSVTIDIGDSSIFVGNFINALIDFALVAFVLFLVIKGAAKAMRPQGAPDEPPSTRECPFCKTAIPVSATRCSACTSEVQPV